MELTQEQEQAHNEKMLKTFNEANGEPEPEPEAATELPEGVTMEMLLEAYGKTTKTVETDTESDVVPKDEPQDEPESDPKANPLEERIKQLEDELIQNNIYAEAGGKDAYESLRTQAEENFTEPQLALMNMAITEGTAEQAVAAIQFMKTIFSQQPNAEPIERNPQELEGKTQVSTSAYQSEGDFHAALTNPLYKNKSAEGEKYRAEINRKLKNSKF